MDMSPSKERNIDQRKLRKAKSQDHQTHQRGYGSQRAGTSQDHRRHPPPSLTSGFSQSSFDSPSSYLSTPKELFGYEKASNKFSSGAGADAANASKQGNEQQTGESISGMLSNFSKALGDIRDIREKRMKNLGNSPRPSPSIDSDIEKVNHILKREGHSESTYTSRGDHHSQHR